METHPATTSQTASHLEALLACGVLRIIPVPEKPRNHGCPDFFLEMFRVVFFVFLSQKKCEHQYCFVSLLVVVVL